MHDLRLQCLLCVRRVKLDQMLFCDKKLEIRPLELLEGLAIGLDSELKFVRLQVAIHLQRLLAFRPKTGEPSLRLRRQHLHQRGTLFCDLVIAALEGGRVHPVLETFVKGEGRYDRGLYSKSEEPNGMLAEAENAEA